MRGLILLVVFALAPGMAAAAPRDTGGPALSAASAGAFIVLCYHEVRADVRDYPDPFAVDEASLVAQLGWLRGNGYTPVSLDQIVAARRGGPPLPPRAVLLSFDDGYLSFYTRVYPLLREFGYPAVLAVVGAWIDAPRGGTARYGERGTVPDADFPTWAQLREMSASGLVEIASHSYDLHRGVPANPQGNVEPAATTRIYDASSGTYEDDAAWRARVRADLERNAVAIEQGTGRRPRAIAWPYGSYNNELVRMAAELGSPIALTLGDGANTPGVPLDAVRRVLIAHNPSLSDFAAEVRGPQFPAPLRAVRIDLDELYSADKPEAERKLSALLDRMRVLRPSHLYLTAYSPATGAAYFPNRHLPVRADLFNRVAWQLATRAEVKVFAVHPASALGLEAQAQLLEDLARHAAFDGVLFEDEALPAGQARLLAAGAARFRAPIAIARRVGTAPHGALIQHEPAVPGEAARSIPLLNAADGGEALAGRMRALQLGGAIDFGYDADDFLRDAPSLAQTAPALSLRAFPAAARSGGAQ